MAEHPEDRERERIAERTHTTHVTETRSGSTGIAAIVGGLLVAVVVLFFLFGGLGGPDEEAEISETNVSVESEPVGQGVDTLEPADEPVEEPAADAPVDEPAEIEATEEPVEGENTAN